MDIMAAYRLPPGSAWLSQRSPDPTEQVVFARLQEEVP